MVASAFLQKLHSSLRTMSFLDALTSSHFPCTQKGPQNMMTCVRCFECSLDLDIATHCHRSLHWFRLGRRIYPVICKSSQECPGYPKGHPQFDGKISGLGIEVRLCDDQVRLSMTSYALEFIYEIVEILLPRGSSPRP